MISFLRKTFITGLLLLIPIFFVLFALKNTFGSLKKLVAPIAAKLDVDRIVGILLLDGFALAVLVVIIFVLGLVAALPAIAGRVDQLDRLLSDRVPGYTIFKGILGGVVKDDTSIGSLKTVLVRYNETGRIGFEVERSDTGIVVVFLPNTPNPQTGTAAAFPAEQVERLGIPPHKAIEMLNFFGKGVTEQVDLVRTKRGVASVPEG